MSEMKHVRVFILGAGCSSKLGYPIGTDLTRQLQEFYWEIPGDCSHIKQSVSDTMTLMQGLPAIETLDQLAKQIDDDFLTWSAQRGSNIADQSYLDRERLADKQNIGCQDRRGCNVRRPGENHSKSKIARLSPLPRIRVRR